MDEQRYSRRDFMALAGVGGLVFASGLPGCATFGTPGSGNRDFSFVQLSDVHWGYGNAKVNPDGRATVMRAIAAVNGMEQKPDMVVFTGDLTQSTDDPKLRRQRLREIKEMTAALNVPQLRFFAGEHDASLDRGEAYLEVFGGSLHYSFDHKGVHFIVLDNTSDPAPILGAAQLAWLKADLARFSPDAPIVVLTHRPLFALLPQWDWATRDGVAAVELLMPYRNVTVFYGHIHHEHHHTTGHIEHHAAMAVMFPLSPAGTAPQKTQLPWDASQPYKGLGWRAVRASASGSRPVSREMPLANS
ncbi:MAG: metallophosphoesterase [Candidatus Parcubacteria bacterium]|nr:metallophosphoesterase [Burkholderiales bacterium]